MSLNNADLTHCVAQFECGDERATAFFVAADIAITCRHCVLPNLMAGTPIKINFAGEAIDAELAEPAIPDHHDVVLLKLAAPASGSKLLPLAASHLPADSPWQTFGFPQSRGPNGMAIQGVVATSIRTDDQPCDVELRCAGTDLPKSFRGFSGSPVIIDGAARAILQVRFDGALGAISLWRLQGYLDSAQVRFRSAQNLEPLSRPLQKELALTAPNTRTFRDLESSMLRAKTGYVLLSGSPGSGKTFVVAGFQPAADRIKVLGRYFASGHSESDLPASYHGRLAPFAQWLSNEASIRSRASVAAPADSTIEKFTKSIVANFGALAKSASDGLVSLLIDGAEVDDPQTTEFIVSLPNVPPEGLVVVISTSNVAAFRTRFPRLQVSDEIHVQPLPTYDCEWLVGRSLSGRAGPAAIASIAQASQGHPLTLSYLIRDVSAAIDRGDANPLQALESAHERGLAGYYDKVWGRFADVVGAQYLLSVIARLRQGVSEDHLARILPSDQQPSFLNALARSRHVLRSDGGVVRFYHGSFREFVLDRTNAIDGILHDLIAKYCQSNVGTEYSNANVLYHRIKGSADRRETARLCTQQWADRAALSFVPPDLVMPDIDEVLSERIVAGDLTESVRLLLLRSRCETRYNHLLARFASRFALVATVLRAAKSALPFLLRNGSYLISPDETLAVLRILSASGYTAELLDLFQEFRRRCWAYYERGEFVIEVLVAHMRASCIVSLGGERDHAILGGDELRRIYHLLQTGLEQSENPQVDDDFILSSALGAVGGELLWRVGFAPCNPKDAVELAGALEEARALSQAQGYRAPLREVPRMDSTETSHRLLNRAEIANALKNAANEGPIPPGAEELVASNLIRASDSFAAVAELSKSAALRQREVSLRQGNGVDPNLLALQHFMFLHEASAFTDDHFIRELVTYSSRHEWEKQLFDVAQWLANLRGRFHRARALGNQRESLMESLKRDFFPRLQFSLRERSTWQDACHIPEFVVPRLMFQAAETVCELEPESSADFAHGVLESLPSQAGLYTEGYQRVLKATADALGSSPQGIQPAADLYRALRAHVAKHVFARETRVRYLLDCAQFLGRTGDRESAESSLQEAIECSVGPAWYKEDQFRLLMDAIETVNDQAFSGAQWKKAVEVLALASGESTFQRFVRQQKERLVRHLSEVGLRSESLATYRHYVTPTLSLQKSRMTRVGIDMISSLSGDRHGVLEIDEQAGVISLLSGLGNASPLRRWAVIELFWPWGDERYAGEFATILCETLSAGPKDVIGERFLQFLRRDVDPKRRSRLRDAIAAADPQDVAAPWLEAARKRGLLSDANVVADQHGDIRPPAIPPQVAPTDHRSESDLLVPGVFGRRASLGALKDVNATAGQRVARGDLATARKQLIDALREAQRGEWDIWEGSSDAEEALASLFNKCGSVEVVLPGLIELVMKERHAASWRVAEALFLAAVPILDEGARRGLFDIVVSHIEYLVGPEKQNLSIAAELQELPENAISVNADDCLDELLISVLDHPNVRMARRAADCLEWLVRQGVMAPELLVDRATKEVGQGGGELAAGVVHSLVVRGIIDPKRLSETAGFKQLTARRSYAARYLVEAAGKEWIGNAAPSPSEPSMEFNQLEYLVSPVLDFADQHRDGILQRIYSVCAPLTPGEVKELTDVRVQAFGAPSPQRGYVFEREAIFDVLAGTVEPDIRQRLDSLLSWNPFWPEAQSSTTWAPAMSRLLDALESGDVRSALTFGNTTLIHCMEFEPPEGDESFMISEIIAIMVPDIYFQGKLDLEDLWEHRTVFEREGSPNEPSLLAKLQEHAVARFEPHVAAGGDFTPAVPSRRFEELFGKTQIDRLCWREGRRWDLWGPGPPLAHGIATLIELPPTLLGYELVWVLVRGGRPACIVEPKRNQIHGV